ncbi:hypothetical protein FACS189472_03860 [Alphaproteobacteria bacterium]|nr:hypothetical protein FACS189472_03860 [Alphaproteobacteria bacterium]
MRIDIIVPTFDASSYEVTLTAWYKKVGERISKNEIIADAETSMIACGITSSYDCILAKIIAKEGSCIPQGSRIAIIETDVNADITRITQEIEAEELLNESREVKKEIEDEYKNLPPELVAELKQRRELEQETLRRSRSLRNSSTDSMENKTELKDAPPTEYKLSVDGVTDSLVDKTATVSMFSSFADSIIEEMQEAEEIKETVLEDLNEEAVKSVIETTKNQVVDESKILREKVLEEAKKVALKQAEELTLKILREYGEKATKEAREAHDKIVQGSMLEAENTKNKIINDVTEAAKQEAETIKAELIQKAEKEAEAKAQEILEETVAAAREKAKEEAETVTKEIVEESIREAKDEAKAIKKEIIHSAQKFDEEIRESERKIAEADSIRKDIIQTANAEAEELKQRALDNANLEAEELKKELLSFTRKEFHALLDDIKKEARLEIKSTIASIVSNVRAEANEKLKGTCKVAMQKIDEAIEKENNFKKSLIEGRIEDLKSTKEIVRKLLTTPMENSPEMFADTWNKPMFFSSPGDETVPIDFLKRRINEKLKSSMESSVISTVSNEVDMSAVLTIERTFGQQFTEKYNTRLGFTPFFILASISSLKEYKIFNAHIHGENIIYKNNYDISIITCGNDGIAAPVIRNADKLSIADIEKSMIALSKRAVEGTLTLEEVSGGTFTVVNAGVYGSIMGTDLLTPPQVATLSVHRMHDRPVAVDTGPIAKPTISEDFLGQRDVGSNNDEMRVLQAPTTKISDGGRFSNRSIGVEVKPMLYISLSYDHRISDTKTASEFLISIKKYVENPGSSLLGL